MGYGRTLPGRSAHRPKLRHRHNITKRSGRSERIIRSETCDSGAVFDVLFTAFFHLFFLFSASSALFRPKIWWGGEFPNFAPGIGTLIASKGIPAPPFGSRPASKKRRIVFFRFPPGIVRTSAARHPDRRNPDFSSPLYPPRRFPDEARIASGQTKPSRSAKSNPKNKALPMKH